MQSNADVDYDDEHRSAEHEHGSSVTATRPRHPSPAHSAFPQAIWLAGCVRFRVGASRGRLQQRGLGAFNRPVYTGPLSGALDGARGALERGAWSDYCPTLRDLRGSIKANTLDAQTGLRTSFVVDP